MKIDSTPVNSAQLSAVTPYAIPTDFFNGVDQAIKLPVINGTATGLENFRVNSNGDLQYSGDDHRSIRLNALFSFGSVHPSQNVPAGLDEGPKATMWFYFKVGTQKGTATRMDQTIYLASYEWPGTRYSVEFSDTFLFNNNDVIEAYAWYEWTTPPVAPLDPATFHFKIDLASLSIAAFSARDNNEDAKEEKANSVGLFTYSEEINAEIPFGNYINYKVWSFKPQISGRVFIDVRMNIKDEKAKLDSGAIVPIFGSNWFTYLSINGVLQPLFVNFATIANSPVLYNGSVFPSSKVFYLLADLQAGDEVSVLVMHNTDALIFITQPPYFAPIHSQGIVADLQFHAIVTPALVTNGLLRSLSDSAVTIPLDSSLDTPVIFPWANARLDFGDGFQFRSNKLTYVASKPRWFKVSAELNISGLELKTSDGATVVIDIQTLGFAIGVDGKKYNLIRTESNVYSDTRYTLRLLANQTTTNVIQLARDQSLTILVYFFNSKYLNQPAVPGSGAPSLTPAPGSVINLKGSVALSVESEPDDSFAGPKKAEQAIRRK